MKPEVIDSRINQISERIALLSDQSGFDSTTDVLMEAYIEGMYAEREYLEKALKEYRLEESYREFL